MSKHVKRMDRPIRSSDNSGEFTKFFRNYVNGWVAVAVLLPTAITWKGMPVYQSQRGVLTTYTALTCVLTLAFLFYSRDLFAATRNIRSRLGAIGMFCLPLITIFAAGFCGYKYVQLLSESAFYAQKHVEEALPTLSMDQIQGGTSLIVYYILTVAFAEVALFLMAFREWKPREGRVD